MKWICWQCGRCCLRLQKYKIKKQNNKKIQDAKIKEIQQTFKNIKLEPNLLSVWQVWLEVAHRHESIGRRLLSPTLEKPFNISIPQCRDRSAPAH